MSIIKLIDEGQKCVVRIGDINHDELPTQSGVVFIFKDALTELIFEDTDINNNNKGQENTEAFVLQNYYDELPIDTIFVNVVDNIKVEIMRLKKGEKSKMKPSQYSLKIFSQIKNREKLFVGYVRDQGLNIKKKEIIDFIVEKEHTKPVMNRVFKSNDAIPSWSGFNFQGFVTLLRVMQVINVTSNKDMELFEVEIEKYEDFVIYKNGIAEEIYQVKAYVAEKDVSVYAEALEKLLLHKEQLKNPKAICYIVTAAEISKWDQSKYKEVITRYKYESEYHIEMNSLFSSIKTEINHFYINVGKKVQSLDIELAFAYLSRLLATKITELHNNKNKTKEDYIIKFSDIIQSLLDATLETEENNLTVMKLRIYEQSMKNINEYIKLFCIQCGHEDCNECSINNLREVIEFVDISQYAQIISPEEIVDDKYVYIPAAFSRNNIFEILKDLYYSDVELFYHNEEYIYINNPNPLIEYMDRIIPSSISLENNLSENRGLSKLLEIFEHKTNLHSKINRSAITATMTHQVVNFKQQKVAEISHSLLTGEENQQKEKISIDFDFNLINRHSYRTGGGYNE